MQKNEDAEEVLDYLNRLGEDIRDSENDLTLFSCIDRGCGFYSIGVSQVKGDKPWTHRLRGRYGSN